LLGRLLRSELRLCHEALQEEALWWPAEQIVQLQEEPPVLLRSELRLRRWLLRRGRLLRSKLRLCG